MPPPADAPLLLVVDDNPLNVEPLCDLLEAMGYRVDKALDGVTALKLVEERPPDLILLDIMMPGMNGYEVCTRLKRDTRFARIPVVFVTALAETEDKVKAIDAGGDDFLTKPFNRPILLARIRSLLRLKQASDELEESYRKRQALERMKDDLMKMIVHDLKSPLSGLLATLEMVLDGDLGEVPGPLHELLSDAQGYGLDMLQLIDDLLELTRLEESRLVLDRESITVEQLFTSIAEDWTLRADQTGALLQVGDHNGLVVVADLHLLKRVFSNLVGNALRHGGDGVRVRVEAAEEPQSAAVLFSVSDDGVGIAPAYHDLIFRKFGTLQRTDSSGHPSSGIGLTFCKLAIEAHGGRIWVESEEGQGSTFRFLIPRGAPDNAESGAAA